MGSYYHQHCSSSHQSPRFSQLCCCWSTAHQHCSSSLLLVIGLLVNLLINIAAHEPLVNVCYSSSSFFTAATLYGLLTAYQVINLQCLYSCRCITAISSLSYSICQASYCVNMETVVINIVFMIRVHRLSHYCHTVVDVKLSSCQARVVTCTFLNQQYNHIYFQTFASATNPIVARISSFQ